MDDREIANIAVEAVVNFITVTKREPITGASIDCLENMIAASLLKHRHNKQNEPDQVNTCPACGRLGDDRIKACFYFKQV